ncbi:MAG: hypothetical protein EHM55_26645, partial [Acidobacteria bacterium]
MSAIDEAMTSGSVVRTGRWLCLGGATLGGIGLLGWVSGTMALTTLGQGQPLMMPNTALALLLIGSAGAARHRDDVGATQRTLSVLAALVVLGIGIGTLAEYWFGVDLRIDHLLVRNQTIGIARPSPLTALALSCLATALLLFDVRATARVRPSEWFVLCAALMAFVGITGFMLGVAPLYRLTRVPIIGLSLPAAISLLLTSTGLLLERPTAGIMRLVTSPSPGSIQLRRLVLPAVGVPVLLGLVVTRFSAAER